MNTQIESGLRVTVAALLAVVLTSIVVGGIGNGSGSTAARAAALDMRLTHQVAPALAAMASPTDAPARLG
jgi:hypothetical protein